MTRHFLLLFLWTINLLNKSEIRKKLLTVRRAIDIQTRSSAARAAAEIFIQSDLFKTSHHIAGYFSLSDEFDVAPLLEAIFAAKKRCYLPVLGEQELKFSSYRPGDRLEKNRYQIWEPSGTEEISPHQLDLVLVPLVGFDSNGNRLGMGGGNYDRTFRFLMSGEKKPFLLGVGYEAQRVEQLPVDQWDVSLDGVLTESILNSPSSTRGGRG